jgi:hypothetical protein
MTTKEPEDLFMQKLCDQKHAEIDRRIAVVETSLQLNFERIYTKINTETLLWASKAAESAKRPGWATLAIITFLSCLSVGLIVAALFQDAHAVMK